MIDKDEAMKLALEALENSKEIIVITQEMGIRFGVPAPKLKLGEVLIQDRAITAIKQALAAPVQEPVAWVPCLYPGHYITLTKPPESWKMIPLYTTPPAAPVPMTTAQRKRLIQQECRYTSEAATDDHHYLIQAAEKFHGIKEQP